MILFISLGWSCKIKNHIRVLNKFKQKNISCESFPLDFLNSDFEKIDQETTYHIHCAGGYRSVIAISLLMQRGYTNLINVTDGYDAIKRTHIPRTIKNETVE